jgi:hypothetical protein
VNDGLPEFRVYPGKIALATNFKFVITSANSFRYFWGQHGEGMKSARALLGRLPEDARVRVVSAYTGQAIDADAISKMKTDHGNFVLNGKKIAMKGYEDRPNFKSCYDGEDTVNGLALGEVLLDVTYEDSAVKDASLTERWNTYTPQFKRCVLDTARAYRMADSKPSRFQFAL